MRKSCVKCKLEKSLSEYFKNSSSKDGANSVCKTCHKEHLKNYYLTYPDKKKKSSNEKHNKLIRKYIVRQIKSDSKCYFCREDNYVCLDFHHLYNKTDSISDLTENGSMKRILTEIEKCIVVCSNCHRKIHAGLLDCIDTQPISCTEWKNIKTLSFSLYFPHLLEKEHKNL